MQLLLIISLICLTCVFRQGFCNDAKSSLLSVQVIVRHGDREPDDDLQNPLGKLTDKGKKQMYDFGVFLRGKYDKFIENKSGTSTTSILSSDKGRTIESALLVALGLFKSTNQNSQLIGDKIVHIPFPVRTIPGEIDDFIQTSRSCPRFQKLLDDAITIYVNDFIERNRPFFGKYALATGRWDVLNRTESSDKIDAFVFYQEESIYNMTMGIPIDEISLETVLNPDLVFKPGYEALKVDNPQMQRLFMGPLFRQISNTFLGDDTKKLTIYSGHDRNMYTFMLTVGIWQEPDRTPPYGSALFVELHEADPQQNYLEFWYKNDTGIYFLEVPRCGNPCLFSQFVHLFQHVISGDNQIECQLQYPDHKINIEYLRSSGTSYFLA